jgi:hypothetical protein
LSHSTIRERGEKKKKKEGKEREGKRKEERKRTTHAGMWKEALSGTIN